MFRKLIPAVLLIPLTLGCESGGGKAQPAPAAAPVAVPASASEKAAAPSGAAVTSDLIPTSSARRTDPVYAYVDEVRSELSDGKAALINRVMRLTKEESAVFWPVYHEYEDELFAQGDQRVELIRKFTKAQTDQTLDDATAASLSDDWFKFESERLELVHKYHDRIAKELSPLRAAQFTQIEHRVGTVIDLLIASDLPLIQTPVRH